MQILINLISQSASTRKPFTSLEKRRSIYHKIARCIYSVTWPALPNEFLDYWWWECRYIHIYNDHLNTKYSILSKKFIFDQRHKIYIRKLYPEKTIRPWYAHSNEPKMSTTISLTSLRENVQSLQTIYIPILIHTRATWLVCDF